MPAMDFPNSPAVGDTFGSSGTVWRWNGARWTSTIGPSGPRGIMAVKFGGTTDTNVAVGTAIPGLTTTSALNFKAGRKYRISANWNAGNHSAETVDHFETYSLRLDSSEVHTKSMTNRAPGSWFHIVNLEYIYEPTTDVSRVVSAFSQTQSYYVGSFNRQGILLVEDVTYEAGSAGNNIPAPIGGTWKRVAGLAIATGTWVTIPYDTEVVDTHGFLTPTSGTWTCPPDQGGIYTVSLNGAVGASVTLNILPSNAYSIASNQPDIATGWCNVSMTQKFAPGESFYTRVWQNSGSTSTPTNGFQLDVWRVA